MDDSLANQLVEIIASFKKKPLKKSLGFDVAMEPVPLSEKMKP